MTARTRPDITSWDPTYKPTRVSPWPNLLVSGSSYTDNISMTETVTWPWYLKTLLGFQTVYDCSQSGAGNDHIYNSVINECETNPGIANTTTLVVVMWSGWSRADVIADQETSKTFHPMSRYDFSSNYSTLGLFRKSLGNPTPAEKLCSQYKQVIRPEAQIYESCLRMIGLKNYLENKKFRHVFVTWKPVAQEYESVKDDHVQKLARQITEMMAPLPSLDEYARERHLMGADGYPDTEAHLRWARNILGPHILSL